MPFSHEKLQVSLNKIVFFQQNILLEQYNENKKLFNQNTQLSTRLDFLNSEMAKFKEEHNFSLAQLSKLEVVT